ncbi:MAG TPA: hypothetical protein ENH41_01570 [Candidatus Omnitrophica bacterium]|nr:hypothetical protein [Candidatus Omnitrophota bacterium]
MLKKILLVLFIIYISIYIYKANKMLPGNATELKRHFYRSEISLEKYQKGKKENTLINQLLKPLEVIRYF